MLAKDLPGISDSIAVSGHFGQDLREGAVMEQIESEAFREILRQHRAQDDNDWIAANFSSVSPAAPPPPLLQAASPDSPAPLLPPWYSLADVRSLPDILRGPRDGPRGSRACSP